MYGSMVQNAAAGCIKPAAVVFGASSASETRPEGSGAVFVWRPKRGGAQRATFTPASIYIQNPAAGTLIGSAQVMSAIDKRERFN